MSGDTPRAPAPLEPVPAPCPLSLESLPAPVVLSWEVSQEGLCREFPPESLPREVREVVQQLFQP